MIPLNRLCFFCNDPRYLPPTSITLTDDQVQNAVFDDIASLISHKLATKLDQRVPPWLHIWELNEPVTSSLPGAHVALSDIAKKLSIMAPIQPYVLRGTESFSLVVEMIDAHQEKHALEEGPEDVVAIVKRTKVWSPSTTAEGDKFRKYRVAGMGNWLVDDRYPMVQPLPDGIDDLPPISLQYHGFGHFLDIFRGCKDVPGTEHVSPSGIRSAVDRFAEKMTMLYPDEASKNLAGLPALREIFSARTDQLFFPLYEGSIGSRTMTGGHILGPHEATYCIVGLKNEVTADRIPYVEMVTSFQHSTRQSTNSFPSVLRAWNIPCLGMTIIGPCITFYAMICYSDWRVIALTPGLSCVRASGDGDDRNALYNAFTAASVLLACIRQDAIKFTQSPHDPIKGDRSLPTVSTLRSFSVGFRFSARFSPERPDRQLYLAEFGGRQVIVKFARRYSYELHKCCADQGCAPELLGFDRLPGGFFCIVMEFVQLAEEISDYARDPNIGKWAKQLEDVVAVFHAKDLVHGDLRSPNTLCDGKRVMLIDFDWGGKEGEVSYPEVELNTDLTDGRTNTDLKITKADDLRVLCGMLKSMGLACGYCVKGGLT